MTRDAIHDRILDDEALTGDLDVRDAEVVVAWLLERAERFADHEGAADRVDALCRQVRAVGKAHAAIRDGQVKTAAEWAARAEIELVADGPDLIQRLLSQVELSTPAKG